MDNPEIPDTVQSACDHFRAALHGAQLQSLFDHLPGVYFVAKDCSGRVMMANEVAAGLCGFDSSDEMLGKRDHDIFSAERADVYVADDRHVFETGERIIERVELAPDPDHAINWFVTTKIPLYGEDGGIIGLACIARNMTDAHEKLRPYVEMNEVLEHVRQHYADPIRIDDLAGLMNLSPSQFERRFKKVFQISPTKHILNVRIRAACRRLSNTNDTVAAIALESGFYDQSHFIRTFRKVMGASPREFRDQGGKKPW